MSRREPDREREPERERPQPDRLPERQPERTRDIPLPLKQVIRLKQSQIDVLYDAGRFRVVTAEGIAKYRYGGDHVAMRKDVDFLHRHGLLLRRPVASLTGDNWQSITLTRTGLRRIRSLYYGSGQRFYAGIARPHDMEHDKEIYGMYHSKKEELISAGMKPLRVVLDHELKGDVFSKVHEAEDKDGWRDWRTVVRMNSPEARKREAARIRTAAAAAHDLEVINGHIQFPDVRIEYEKPDGEIARVDLEYVTEGYSRATVAAKQAAGMHIYGQKTPTWGYTRDPKIAAETFSI